jgi:formate hydrogenlyase subunit 3/multisubunit Na+/H+ antiporter MnhD subunit
MSLVWLGLFVLIVATLLALLLPEPSGRFVGALGGGLELVGGVLALFQPAHTVPLWPLAGFTLRLTLDPLSAAFLIILGLGFPLLLMGRSSRLGHTSLLILYFGSFLTVLAGDSLSFLLAWELMGLAAYAFSAACRGYSSYRMAAFLEIGTLALFLALGWLSAQAGSFNFTALVQHASPSTLVFILIIIGFGAKLGLLGLHGWYPQLYADTPGSVAGLYSGPLWAAAIYGLVRFLSFLTPWPLGWGVALAIVGVLTALFATLYSLTESDGKRLLAFSTVEYSGVALLLLGAGMVFASSQQLLLAGLGFVVALYLAAHHTLSKGLALGSFGAACAQTGERNLDRLGGLRRAMPVTSASGLLGFLSLAAIPPFSGFVVEWLVFMLLFQEFRLETLGVRLVMVVCGALFALLAALGLVADIKMYSVGYLGQPRSEAAAKAKEAAWPVRLGLVLLSLLLIALSALPLVVIPWLERPVEALIGVQLAGKIAPANLQINPAYSNFAAISSSGLTVFLPVTAGIIGLIILFGHLLKGSRRRVVPLWVAASGDTEAHVQYSASAYTNPMRVFFTIIYRPIIERSGDEIRTSVRDWFEDGLYSRLSRVFGALTRTITRLQAGRVTVYTAYILVVFVIVLLIGRLLQ